MEESLILYYVDWFTPTLDETNKSSNMILLNEDTYHTLIQSINVNCLLFLFMFTCFSTMIVCAQRDKPNYKPIPATEIIEVQNDNMEKGKISI